MKKFLRHPLVNRFLAALLAFYGKLVFATSRTVIITPLPAELQTGPVVFALWHQHIGSIPLLASPSPHPLMGLMSASRDGTLTRAISKWFGIKAIVGSSSKGAVSGTRGLIRAVREGHSLFLTPDGPRGPIYIAKQGATEIARITGAPLIPCAGWPVHGHTFASWDNFRLPYPFTTFYLAYAPPPHPNTLQSLQEALNALTAQAQAAGRALASGKPTA